MDSAAANAPENCAADGHRRCHLYLVDGSAYIFRAYHRLPPLTNPVGTPVGAVYGYTTMLWKLAEDLHKADGPTHLAVILDKGSKSFRNDIYPEYKANRPPPPEDLIPQFPLIARRRAPSRCPASRKPGWRLTISSPPTHVPPWHRAGT
jgi:DNA polymerase-1